MFYKSPQKIKSDLKKCYQEIAVDFSESRKYGWPEFDFFLEYIQEGNKVLDLGCGNGRFFGFLKEQSLVVDYIGVDFSSELLKIAKRRYPKQDFLEQDITRLDINKRFDCVVCIATLHHLPNKRQRETALKMIFEHLEDDGVLILSVWNLWQWKFIGAHLKALLRWVLSFFRNDPRGLYIPFGKEKIKRYYHAFFALELRRLLKKRSFQVEEFRVSSHNFIFVCKKKMYKPAAEAVINHKKLAKSLPRSSAIATCKKN